ncbi:hypothetical protein GCM10010363_25650 [Streptomyces omiyaensis]|nr:hypothetical protein GCM10010363_25650 [Streptomyces omiyaensis]
MTVVLAADFAGAFAEVPAGAFAEVLAGAFATAPDFLPAVTGFFPVTARGDESSRFAPFDRFDAPCSPTAEFPSADTLPAPLACVLTGELDTRPA